MNGATSRFRLYAGTGSSHEALLLSIHCHYQSYFNAPMYTIADPRHLHSPPFSLPPPPSSVPSPPIVSPQKKYHDIMCHLRWLSEHGLGADEVRMGRYLLGSRSRDDLDSVRFKGFPSPQWSYVHSFYLL